MRQNRTISVRGLCQAGAIAVAAGTIFGVTGAALAAPQGEQVVRGHADFARDGATTTIRAANGTIINYSSFDIAATETVRFVQPTAQSRVLNRVQSTLPTRVDGALFANGQVFIVNPAGVMFGANSTVNAGKLFAAAGDISNADFAAGINRFSNVQGGITAQGFITADAVHLIGSSVANHGTIIAPGGLVTLTVGDEVLLRERGGRVSVSLDGAEVDASAAASDGDAGDLNATTSPAIDNSGVIEAGRGRITLAAGDAVSIAVRNAGRLRAEGGEVHLNARRGAVANDGVIEAGDGAATLSGPMVANRGEITAAGDGGRVTLKGHHGALGGERSTTAAGDGGVVSVSASGGDAALSAGSLVTVGDRGTVRLTAADRVAAQGAITGGGDGGALDIEPTNLTISTDGSNDVDFFGSASRNDGDFFVSAAAVEGFDGDVSLAATNDIFVFESIAKANGGLALDAGNDLVFGESDGGFTIDLGVSADFLDLSAGADIVDMVIFETALAANSGDITLQALGGSVGIFSDVTVADGRTVTIRQRDTRVLEASGPNALLTNPDGTNLVVDITGGDLLVGGQFAGLDEPAQRSLSFDATASGDIVFDNSYVTTSTMRVNAGNDLVFGREPVLPEPPGGFTQQLDITGSDVTLRARDHIVDFAIFGTALTAASGDMALEATNGAIDFGTADLQTGRTLSLTQADDLFLITSGPNGQLPNALGTNVVVNVTVGDFTLGGEFAGFSEGEQLVRSLRATADDIVFADSLFAARAVDLDARSDVLAAPDPTLPEPPGGFTDGIDVTASSIDVDAGGSVRDNTIFGSRFTATTGDIKMVARTGSVNIGTATVADNRTVSITQADTRFHDARVLGNGDGTNLVLTVTDGDLVFDAAFADDANPTNTVRSLRGAASGDVIVRDAIDAATFAELDAQNDVVVSADIIARDRIDLLAARSGAGVVAFEPGADRLGADTITLRALADTGAGSGSVVTLSSPPTITGADAMNNPNAFSIIQDAAITDATTPSASSFAEGAPVGVAYLLESRTGDVIILDGAAVRGSMLSVRTPSGADSDDPAVARLRNGFDLTSLVVDSNAELSDTVTADSTQSYNGAVLLLSDTQLDASAVTFAGAVDASGDAPAALVVDADAALNGPVGQAEALASLDISGDATIAGGLVRTRNDQRYGGDVLLTNDTQLITLVDGSVLFGGAIDAADSAETIDLDVVATSNGMIMFGGDVGATNRLGTLRLSTAGDPNAGPADVPDRATIGSRDDLAIFVNDFVLNQNEKVTVLGDLRIDATNTAQFGDLAAAGDIVVLADDIAILRRPGGAVLRSNGTTTNDSRVDLAAGGIIDLRGDIRLAGDPTGADPAFGAARGVVTDLTAGRTVNVAPDFAAPESLVLGETGELLDLRVAAFATPIDIESQLIDQLPDTPEFEDSVTLGVQDIAGLQRLGLTVRTVDGGEAFAGPGGRMLLSDLPADIANYDDAVALAAARFDVDAVRALVARYEAVFGAADADRTDAVAAQVAALAAAYLDDTGADRVDGDSFAQWIANQADRSDAVFLAQLGEVLDGIRGLGLTDREYAQARVNFAAPLAQDTDVSPRELAETLESLELVALLPAESPGNTTPGESLREASVRTDAPASGATARLVMK